MFLESYKKTKTNLSLSLNVESINDDTYIAQINVITYYLHVDIYVCENTMSKCV